MVIVLNEKPAGESRDANLDHVGTHLRAVRLSARKSIAEVAADSQLTKGFLSKLERNQANASVAALMRLCNALGISVGSLFQAATGNVVRREARPPINFGGSGMREYLLTPTSEKRVQAILTDIESDGGSGDEPYSLPADVEFVFVISGSLRIDVAGEPTLLAEGDAFTFVPNTPHAFGAGPSGCGAQVLWVFAPALPDAAERPQPGQTGVSRNPVPTEAKPWRSE